MSKMFGTAGIRGLTFKEITPQLAERIGRAYGNYLENNGLIVIGRDTRFGAETIEHAIIAGMTGSGIDVLRCGIVPTPALARFIEYTGANGAVMITGSHIPPDRVGIMIMLEDSSYIEGDAAQKIEELYLQFSDPKAGYVSSLENVGSVGETADVLEVYADFLLSLVNIELIESNTLRLVVDPVNGTAAQFLAELLREFNYEIITIHDQPSGRPGRSSEPRPWTLEKTAQLVSDVKADFGVALDVDADRVIFIDGNGVTVSADVIGAILLEEILKVNLGTVVLPINTSGLAEVIIEKYNCQAVYSPVGQPGTIATAKKENAIFAYEESGKYYYTGESILWTDAILVILRILEVLQRENITLFELVNRYPKFYTKTINLTVPQDQIASVATKTLDAWRQMEPTIPVVREITLSNGTRKNYEDKSWLLIRPSGTEPLIRVVADAPTESRTDALIEIGRQLVLDAMDKEKK
ncbi:MAG: hypothetical protein ACFFDT_03000 [Candidatus Hodarchaeota archaeon]